jgi:HD-GYP domain-containing protein (c-di-GMP phosphodiesterase class II)
MDAAERTSVDVGSAVPALDGSAEFLERIARVACRTTGAAEVAVLLRQGRHPRSFARVAVHRERTPAEGGARLAAPIAWGGGVRGALEAVGPAGDRRFGRVDMDTLGELAALTSDALEEAERRERLEDIVHAGADALVRAVDMRDDYTGRHSECVGELSRRVGERLGIGGIDLWLLELAGRLHDVGKIGVPDAILSKPGPLDSAEWELMRRHPEMGAEAVSRLPGLGAVAPLVRSHHERWDGDGYPDRLVGDEIPLASRVICTCDAFVAMTSDRPYRPALNVDQALAELVSGAGSQFDPRVVQALRTHARM